MLQRATENCNLPTFGSDEATITNVLRQNKCFTAFSQQIINYEKLICCFKKR